MSMILAALTAALAVLLPAAPAAAESEILSYAGATTLQRHFMPEAAQVFMLETGTPFHIAGGNSDPGIRALRDGTVNLAGSGRFLRPEEKAGGLAETLIGWDAMLVLVHRSNPVEDLTLEQLRGIFGGRITNWREIGGPDRPILVIGYPKGSGMRESILADLQLETITSQEIVAALVADGDRQVAVLPSAITILSKSMVDSAEVKTARVNGILPTPETVTGGQYPLVKPLLLVTRGKPAGLAGRFVEFALGDRGQRIISRHFYPVR